VQSGKPFTTVFLLANVGVPLLATRRCARRSTCRWTARPSSARPFNGQAQAAGRPRAAADAGYDKGLSATARRTSSGPRAHQGGRGGGQAGRDPQPEHPLLAAPGQIVERTCATSGSAARSLYLDEATYNERQFDPKGHELAVNQRTQFVPDPDDMLSPAAHERLVRQPDRHAALPLDSQAELDERLAAALTETDEEARRKLYVDLQRFLAEDVNVFFPLAYVGCR
jgi:hypothetical protein